MTVLPTIGLRHTLSYTFSLRRWQAGVSASTLASTTDGLHGQSLQLVCTTLYLNEVLCIMTTLLS